MLTTTQGILLIMSYAIIMTAVVWFNRNKNQSTDDFLVANRKLGTWRGAFSIAVSWIWAPAIFICSMQAYNQGLPGIFWFTFPNILCFFVFAFLAVRLRKILPDGYSLPDFMRLRFEGEKKVHLSSLTVYFGYQLGAVIINAVAGGTLLNLLTGLSFSLSVIIMVLTALAYSLISGLRASVLTDVIQMTMILLIGFIVVPWVIYNAGGFSVVKNGLGGITGEYVNLFDPKVAFGFGIATSIGLISGPIADQMFFQRTFAVKKKSVAKVFIYGGLIFGIVPILLSFLGFLAAAPEVAAKITVSDAQMVGPIVVDYFLPKWALMLFSVMAFAGLSSTLDSAFVASSSLGTIDIARNYFKKEMSTKESLRIARKFMLGIAALGTAIALMKPQLLWVFLIYGAFASATLFPTILAVFWNRLPAKGAFWAIILSLAFGTPLSIYANVSQNTNLIVLSAIASILIGLIVCLIFGFLNQEKFEYNELSK